jgi:hypothetical protein
MKVTNKFGWLILLSATSLNYYSQNVGINSTGAVPNASAALDIDATDKGILIPRMTSAERAAIATPAKGLLVFDHTTSSFWFHDGSVWVENVSSGNDKDGIYDGDGTTPAGTDVTVTDYINFDANTLYVDGTNNRIGIGTAAPDNKLDVEGNIRVNDNDIYLRTTTDVNHGLGYYGGAKLFNGNSPDGPVLYGYSGGILGTKNGGDQGVLYWNNTGKVGIGAVPSTYKLEVNGDIYAKNGGWLRAAGNSGLYFETWGGGWHMTDATWLRTYNNKSIWAGSGVIGTNGSFSVGYSGSAGPVGGAIFAGNVGIGTNSTSANLDVVGTTELNGTVSVANNVWHKSITDNKNRFYFSPNSVTYFGGNGYVWRRSDDAADLLILLDNGNLGVGVSPTYKLHVNGNAFIGSTLFTNGINNSSSITSSTVQAFGGMFSPFFNVTSDKRLKTNIFDIENSIATVMQLRPVTYDKKTSIEEKDYSYNEMGFIAQELQKVLPNTVFEGEDENKLLSVNYTSIIPLLTKAIQEQQAEIDELKRLVNELLNK